MSNEVCVICGKEIPEKRLKQRKDTCCWSCSATKMNRLRWSNKQFKDKMSKSAQKRWSNPKSKASYSKAMKNYWSNEEVRQKQSEKLKAAWSNEEVRQKQSEKSKAAWSNEETRQRASETHKLLWQSESYRTLMIHSQTLAQNRPEVKTKMSKSVSIALNKPEVRQKLSNSIKRAYELNGNEIKLKQASTKRANGTMKYSKAEKQILSLLNAKFDKVVYQYDKDDRYPFRCDFYIPELDLFIEYNGNWTHGGAPYNENELWCIEQLAAWKDKSVTSKYYESAIHVWTISDPQKVSIANNNKLNFKVFYTMEQFNIWYEGV